MHILIAPNAFKNSLGADKAAEAISKGLHQSRLSCTTTCFPVADGGDGTGALLVEHLKGMRMPVMVHDPLGRMIEASIGITDNGQTAIIEMADASGLRLLQRSEYDPLLTSTFGTGELIREAIHRNVSRIIICIGGSATVDGGIGMLQALGVKFTGKNELTAIDISGMIKKPATTEIVVLCDVTNALLGSEGAAAVFGPQKGASPEDVQLLEKKLTRLRDMVLAATGKDMAALKHGGAAGGIAAALHTFLDAKLVNGIDYFLAITDFEKELQKANMVITGEGSMDIQTLQGKGPFGVFQKAEKYSIPVVGMAGRIADEEKLLPYFIKLIPINEDDTDMETALKNTWSNLERTARLLGDQIFLHLT